jgi:hypothetical protein
MSLLATFAADLRALGPANFLYSDGDALFVHSDKRLQRNGSRAGTPLTGLAQFIFMACTSFSSRRYISAANKARPWRSVTAVA